MSTDDHTLLNRWVATSAAPRARRIIKSISPISENPRCGGTPAAGVQLWLEGRVFMKWTQPDSETIDVDEESDYLSAITDEGGHYAFDRLAADAYYRIRVKSPEGGELSARVNLGEFASGEHKTWDHAIGADFRVTGTVTGEQTGKPFRHVRVSALSLAPPN